MIRGILFNTNQPSEVSEGFVCENFLCILKKLLEHAYPYRQIFHVGERENPVWNFCSLNAISAETVRTKHKKAS